MIVVSDADPIHYLVLIDRADVLRALYERVVLPPDVLAELLHAGAPQKVRSWVSLLPEWCEVSAGSSQAPPIGREGLANIDTGEAEVILLAVELGITAVLMDDMDGRSAAKRFGLAVRGTLGILQTAAQLGLIDMKSAMEDLLQTNFRISAKTLHEILKRYETHV